VVASEWTEADGGAVRAMAVSFATGTELQPSERLLLQQALLYKIST